MMLYDRVVPRLRPIDYSALAVDTDHGSRRREALILGRPTGPTAGIVGRVHVEILPTQAFVVHQDRFLARDDVADFLAFTPEHAAIDTFRIPPALPHLDAVIRLSNVGLPAYRFDVMSADLYGDAIRRDQTDVMDTW